MKYLMAGSQAWKSQAKKVKGEFSAVAATARLLFGQNQGGGAVLRVGGARANCKNSKAEAPRAMVCWVCGRNRQDCLANFGLEATIDGQWEVVLLMGAIYRHIPAKRRILDYGLHGVLRVTICGISSMRDALSAATGRSAAVVARNFFRPILDVASMAAKTVTRGRMAKSNENRQRKGRR